MESRMIISGVEHLRKCVGQHLGYSEWLNVSQEMVNTFADATGDHQWIHVDPKRAATGPFGATIAHGFFTLSLAPRLIPTIYTVTGVVMGINYGTNKVRFPSPVPVGSDLRVGVTLIEVTQLKDSVQTTNEAVFEVRNAAKPACVAELVSRLYFAS
jgi:acyl dehydratase